MKLTKAMCAALAVVLLLAAVALAVQAAPKRPKPRAAYGRPGQAMLQHLTKALDLTEDQQAKIKEILQARVQAAENWREEDEEKVKKLREEMKKAHEDNDPEAMKAAREKMRELFQGRQEAGKKVHEQIGAVLNDEQKKKFKKMGPRGRRPGQREPGARPMQPGLGQLDLTDEQKAQVKDIMKAAREKAAKVEDPRAKRKIMAQAFEKIRGTVLTDEQRKKLGKARRRYFAHHRGLQKLIALARELELTDEQKDQIQEVLGAAHKKIRDDVLTDAQRAKLKELLKRRPGIDRPGPAGGRPPRRPGPYGQRRQPKKED